MILRQLGESSISVAPMALGTNVFGWTADRAAAFAQLDACVDMGLNLIDTADVYSAWVPGHKGTESETVIGEWVATRGSSARDKLVIATKVALLPSRPGLSRANITAACDESLKRLNVDVIDLYQAHRDDADTPLEETLGTFADLITAGKVRTIGASNYTGARLTEALAVSKANDLPRYEALQTHYNLYDRATFEADLQPVCVAQNVSVISYFSLANGFLTGKYRSKADFFKSVRSVRIKPYLNDRGQRILAALDDVSQSAQATPAQVALAWLMTRPSVVAPLASATSMDQFKDLVAAAHLSLDATELKLLETASTSAE
jgi:aryl-alcohol dehydrogenase-like predicted oxidoreductase